MRPESKATKLFAIGRLLPGGERDKLPLQAEHGIRNPFLACRAEPRAKVLKFLAVELAEPDRISLRATFIL